jgi:methylated-DNA-[protein]-cysteine S-methyltransferase
MTTYWTTTATPIGELTLLGDGEHLSALYLDGQRHRPPHDPGLVRDDAALAAAVEQLHEYFAGHRTAFDLPLRFAAGTDFQRTVWHALLDIPYGTTTTYAALAAAIGRPSATRAVGLANGKNAVSIVVPCHRVVGHDGSLTGYGGGLDRKRWLLDLEAATLAA